MRTFKIFTNCLLLATTPSFLAYPQNHIHHEENNDFPSYDEILQLINEIESEQFEKKYNLNDLKRINQFLAYLAQQGMLPNEDLTLSEDIAALLDHEDNAFCFDTDYTYEIVPAIFKDHREIVLCKSWIKKKWDQTVKFVKNHKKAIIIGAIVVVATAVIVVAIAAAAPAAASSGSESSTKEALDEQISSLKESIMDEPFLDSEELSLEETGKVLGSLFAHECLNNLNPDFSISDFAHSEIDKKFSADYASLFSHPTKETDFNFYQLRGEKASAFGYDQQAINDFGKAIELNPTNPIPYLERSSSYFNLGQYDRSLEDFYAFTSQAPTTYPLSVTEFSLGFAKGLPQGVYESGEGILLFLADFVTHPIHTAGQVVDAFSTLASLVHNDEWGVIGESLAPEIHQLVTEWDIIPSDKRGELAGFALGKHGADILAPGALAKVASKSVKSAKELAAVCKNLQRAEETLVLETAAGMGSGAKIREVVNAGRSNAFLGEELGFTVQEIGQLQKVGKLEQAIDSACESWLAKSPSEAYIVAKNGGRHADLVPKFSEKPIKEIEKSIHSYEKLIAEHKDKIANPSKYCSDWDNFHPNRQKALVDKIWPAEIQCYTEQKDILQTILDQRH